MKVEIWSDVVCPFCYIGKARFDTALTEFSGKDDLEIEWKSFQLMPGMRTQVGKHIDQVLSELKGVGLEQARQMNAHATLMGRNAGLDFNFDKAVLANTARAHQFLHFAKSVGKQQEAEGVLFRAYFSEGRNVDDIPTLLELGTVLGLDVVALQVALEKQVYASAVAADVHEANELGVRGVPFFVFDRKYAVSGAHDAAAFLSVLEKSWKEWKERISDGAMEVKEGDVCEPDGNCA